MAEKKSFVLRIDPELMKAVEKWASDEFRSINGQIEWIISDAVKKARRSRKSPSKKT
ncbi:MAG: DNA-binding protein [Bacteroidales bacterium]|nr:DNA-binding protein [Bacteroidales bacterium]